MWRVIRGSASMAAVGSHLTAAGGIWIAQGSSSVTEDTEDAEDTGDADAR